MGKDKTEFLQGTLDLLVRNTVDTVRLEHTGGTR